MAIHISASERFDLGPLEVDIKEPWTDDNDASHPAHVDVWPQGKTDFENMRHYWSLDVADAEKLGQALLDAAAEARKLYPDT